MRAFNLRNFGLFALLLIPTAPIAQAAGKEAFLDAKQAGRDFAVQGEYLGTIGTKAKIGAQVIALGDGQFDAVIYTQGLPGAGWDGKTKVRMKGTRSGPDQTVQFKGKNFEGTIVDRVLNGISESGVKGTITERVFSGTAENGVRFELHPTQRTSPTLGAPPPPGAIVLFDGNDTKAWKVAKLEDGRLLGVEAITRDKFENFLLHIEFRTPFMPKARGQGRGNSGVFLIDQYECQVLDSFGLEGADNECGAIYKVSTPMVNMCLPPLAWQTFDIEFRAPRIARDGRKVTNAFVSVQHNGVPVHYNVEVAATTHGGHQTDGGPGPLFLQNHGDPVRYRNIWLLPRP